MFMFRLHLAQLRGTSPAFPEEAKLFSLFAFLPVFGKSAKKRNSSSTIAWLKGCSVPGPEIDLLKLQDTVHCMTACGSFATESAMTGC